MIKVFVKTNKQQIVRITIEGHAQSAEPGEDLICAGVSVAVTGVLNEMIKREFFSQGHGGYELDEGFADIIVGDSDSDIQVVLETLVTILETIEDSNPDYLEIIQREV